MAKSNVDQNKLPPVSIVIPAWNMEKTLGKTLQAIFGLDYPEYEVLVVDDGSVDRTADLALKFPVRLIRHARNLGPSVARNTGAREAKFDFIYFLDADVIVQEKTLSILISRIMDGERVAAVAGPYLCDPSDTSLVRTVYDFVERARDFKGETKASLYVNAANTVVRKSVFEKVGGFDPSFVFTEDFELTFRFSKLGYMNIYEPKAIGFHNNHRTTFKKYLEHTYKIGKFGTLFRLKYRPDVPYSRYLVPNFLAFVLISPIYFFLFCLKIFKENIGIRKLSEFILASPFVVYSQLVYTIGAIQGCREFSRVRKELAFQ